MTGQGLLFISTFQENKFCISYYIYSKSLCDRGSSQIKNPAAKNVYSVAFTACRSKRIGIWFVEIIFSAVCVSKDSIFFWI